MEKQKQKFARPDDKLLKPDLPVDELNKLHDIVKTAVGLAVGDPAKHRDMIAANLRAAVDNERETASEHLLACLSVFADLFEQGWALTKSSELALTPPGLSSRENETPTDVKARLRDYLKSGQVRQLQEPSVKGFLQRMTREVRRSEGKHSIASVIDNGVELAAIIEQAQAFGVEDKEKYLAKHFKPEIEICEGDLRCSDTGLKLIEIWRFFRHTWSTVYRPIPGRQMPVLIRNAGRKNRPIMGIAMLSSPVMRLGPRDKWIGWTFEQVLDRLYGGNLDHQDFINSIYDRLDKSISEIRWDDIASPELINHPTLIGVDSLQRLSTKADFSRQDELIEIYEQAAGEVGSGKDPNVEHMSDADWLAASEDNLFMSKRASTLASLLSAKYELDARNLRQNSSNLRHLMTSKAGRTAVEVALGEFRKAGLASQVMDLSICGAVAPYGGLLAGKLVALAMASQEINEALQKRYGGRVSIISSQMAGRPITRDATLKVVTTTSLYGVGTSQYNRLNLKAADHHGISNNIIWSKLGEHTSGFGQMHLSTETHQFLKKLGWGKKGYANRNSRFGEGTSARMHQARLGLNTLGFQSELVLKHETPRIVLGCDIFSNARENLLGQAPIRVERKASMNAISRAWRKRWLLNRIDNSDVVERLKRENAQSIYASLKIDEMEKTTDTQDGLF